MRLSWVCEGEGEGGRRGRGGGWGGSPRECVEDWGSPELVRGSRDAGEDERRTRSGCDLATRGARRGDDRGGADPLLLLAQLPSQAARQHARSHRCPHPSRPSPVGRPPLLDPSSSSSSSSLIIAPDSASCTLASARHLGQREPGRRTRSTEPLPGRRASLSPPVLPSPRAPPPRPDPLSLCIDSPSPSRPALSSSPPASASTSTSTTRSRRSASASAWRTPPRASAGQRSAARSPSPTRTASPSLTRTSSASGAWSTCVPPPSRPRRPGPRSCLLPPSLAVRLHQLPRHLPRGARQDDDRRRVDRCVLLSLPSLPWRKS